MRPLLPYLLQLLLLTAIAAALHSCTSDRPGWWKNGQIEASKRKDFHRLNEQVIKYLKTNDLKQLQFLLSKEMADDPQTNRKADVLGNYFNTNDYALLDEYYVINKWKDEDTIKNLGKSINSYDLIYPGRAREMYIAIFTPKKGNEQWMITAIYCKYNYGWKVAEFNLAPYTFNGKTAAEIYGEALKQQRQNYFNETTLELAMKCLRPSGIWRYGCDSLVTDAYKNSVVEANKRYSFPFIMKDVPTHPAIFRIFNQTNDEGTYPMIYYISSIKVSDGAAIKKENDAVKKVIGKVIPGIDVTNNYLYFSVMNERPTGEKAIGHVDIDVKVR